MLVVYPDEKAVTTIVPTNSFRGRKQRVRFSETQSIDDVFNRPLVVQQLGPLLKPASALTKNEKSEQWYTGAEARECRQRALEVASVIQHRTESIEKLNPLSYVSVHTKVYRACVSEESLPPKTMNDLAHWHQVGVSRRGLERWSMIEIGNDRLSRVRSTIARVLALQQCKDLENFDCEEKALLIRHQSEQMTLLSKRLAWVFAKADEVAARGDSQNVILQNIIMKCRFKEATRNKIASSCSCSEATHNSKDLDHITTCIYYL